MFMTQSTSLFSHSSQAGSFSSSVGTATSFLVDLVGFLGAVGAVAARGVSGTALLLDFRWGGGGDRDCSSSESSSSSSSLASEGVWDRTRRRCPLGGGGAWTTWDSFLRIVMVRRGGTAVATGCATGCVLGRGRGRGLGPAATPGGTAVLGCLGTGGAGGDRCLGWLTGPEAVAACGTEGWT